jgi:hypothetical protein
LLGIVAVVAEVFCRAAVLAVSVAFKARLKFTAGFGLQSGVQQQHK